MKVPFGYCAVAAKNKLPSEVIYWDSTRLINGHTLLLGMSGSGKRVGRDSCKTQQKQT